MRSFFTKYKLETIIFLIALIARLALFSIEFGHNQGNLIATIHGDDGYYELSQGIMNGHGFTWDVAAPFHPNPLRPPVWPLLIVFFAKAFRSYWAVIAFEIVLGSLIPVLAFYIGQKLFGRIAGKWTALIMCIEPYLVLFSTILYTETSFIFFFLASVIFLLRYIDRQTIRDAVWFGVFLGIAMLIKPTVEFLPIIIPLAFALVWRKRLNREHAKHLSAFLFVFMALISAWLYRNHFEFGVWGMSAQPAFNLYVYLVPTVLAIDNHTDFKTEYTHFVKAGNFDENSITLANSALYKSKAIAVLSEHKIALIQSSIITLITFFTHDGMLTVLGYSGVTIPNFGSKPVISLISNPRELSSMIVRYAASPAIMILIMRMFWIIVTIFFLLGAYRYFMREGLSIGGAAALGLVFYFAATTAINGFGVNARFRMPVDVFILGFALYGLFSLKRDNTPIAER